MKLKGKFEVQEFTNASGTVSWRVTGTKLTGERVRKNFSTEAEATAEKQRLEIEALNVPVATGLKSTRLNDAQLLEAEAAYKKLAGRSLMVAVDYFVANYREPLTAITVKDAFAQFLEDKRRQNCRPDSIENYERKNAMLVKTCGERNVSEVLPDQVKDIIFRPGLAPAYRDNLRRGMGVFFNWCVEQQYCKESPLAKVGAITTERDEPEILPLADVRKLLQAAASYKGGVVLPYVAISVFAAVRPKEISRLSWDDVDLDQKLITIQGKLAKMRERRIVELSENLVAWLKPFALARRPFVGQNWRRDFDTVKQLAGYGGRAPLPAAEERPGKPGPKAKPRPQLKPWPVDIMRHTGISYHLAQHQHEGKTATWAGNSPDVIQRHYRGLVNPKDAKAFWSIRPDAKHPVRLPKVKAEAQAASATPTPAAATV